MIYLLLVIVTILLLLSIAVSGKDLISPPCLICGGFWFATICACLYHDAWNFTNYKLVIVICGGLFCFVLASMFVRFLNGCTKNRPQLERMSEISISTNKLVIYLIFQGLLMLLLLMTLIQNVGIGNGLASAIGLYYEINKAGELEYGLGITNVMQILNLSGNYILIFVMVHNIICKKSNHLLLYINVIIGAISSLLEGTRTSLFMYIIAVIIVVFGEKNKLNGWKGNINFKTVFKLSFVIIGLMIFFNIVASYQGRTLTSMSVVDVFATYLGAPLKNLELFISENHKNDSIFASQTFYNTYTWIYEKTGIMEFNIPKLNEYRFLNGKGLGNVYTFFFPLYHDFGILGSMIVMAIVGVISQKFYDKVKRQRMKSGLDWWLIIYSYVGFAILFSFFSNKFFEQVIARAMIYFVIGLWGFNMFFFRLQIRKYKLVISKGNFGEV